jgi:hypothetical protein
MLDAFKEDFWLISRENRGYYAWAEKDRYHLHKFFHRHHHRFWPCCDGEIDARVFIEDIFTNGFGLHPLLDTVFAAFARAESRFSLRFVPQRSHEERLTGSLVSEIEAAIHLASGHFRRQAEERYREARDVDFIYYDLSRGGRLEKRTGADLGLILHVDLPDWPPLTRYAAFQAKKLDGSAQIDSHQYDTLVSQFSDAAAYLFYDMGFSTLAPPIVIEASDLESSRKEKPSASFSLPGDRVFGGLPLSLWLFSRLAREETGASASSFRAAMDAFVHHQQQVEFTGGRVAVLSVGRRLRLTRDIEAGLRIDV